MFIVSEQSFLNFLSIQGYELIKRMNVEAQILSNSSFCEQFT